ncbi:DUF2231 domain-containing protein [Streptomyces sp. S186]|uniref:DUF2231 domain-containing protein n=1 Tax=Streptomyces sp. S186 TaxID=3434395 RepID=UPI003F66C03C
MAGSSHELAKRPVSAVLAGPYGHPFHPILVTVPIGAWVGSLVFDIASCLVQKPDFLVRGAMWLIALGVIGAVAAALAGFLDLCVIPPGTRALRVALVHMTLNLLVAAAYAANSLWRQADEQAAAGAAAAGEGQRPEPAERHFPVPVVAGHGLFAVATVVLVLLTALGIGGH